MAVVCDDLWPVISDVSFVTSGRRTTEVDLLIYKSGEGVIRFWQLSVTCNLSSTNISFDDGSWRVKLGYCLHLKYCYL